MSLKEPFLLWATAIANFPRGTVGYFTVRYFLLMLFVHYIVVGFRAKLVFISKELSDEDLEHMMFLMRKKLLNGHHESVKLPIELFDLMMKHEMLSKTNLDQLAQLLIDVERKDLSTKVQQMKGKQQ